MVLGFTFFFNSILLGVGLAMDAFSVSLANGLHEPKMKMPRVCLIAGIFAAFQFTMPLIGWFCVSSIAHCFKVFESFIPWIALILLLYIGGSMLYEGLKDKEEDEEPAALGFKALLVQGVATSIDALSVGFTISHYRFAQAVLASLLIGVVTFAICFAGIIIGKKAGTVLANKASILGSVILIFIGIEIFATGVF